MDVEFADPTYTVKELKAKIARIGLKLPARRIQTMFGSGKDGRLVKKDYEKILKMYKNKAVLELIKESTTYTVKELKAKIAEMGFNKKDYRKYSRVRRRSSKKRTKTNKKSKKMRGGVTVRAQDLTRLPSDVFGRCARVFVFEPRSFSVFLYASSESVLLNFS